jgi:hypothetical protein
MIQYVAIMHAKDTVVEPEADVRHGNDRGSDITFKKVAKVRDDLLPGSPRSACRMV